MTRKDALRILDANFNRSREGLRVCEEIARFVLNEEALTKRLKAARHAVSKALKEFPVPFKELVGARDSRGDVGRGESGLEKKRTGTADLFSANIERVKESLRVLEETVKLIDENFSGRFKRIRFNVYSIEKDVLPALEAVRDRGSRGSQGKASRGNRARSASRRR